jgi:L-iditol 2-dehydrogenase
MVYVKTLEELCMKALVKRDRGKNNIGIEEVEEPRIDSDDEIKIAVKAAGICGTDIEILHGRDALFRPPVVMGHEYSGEIVEVGRGVKRFKKGDRVVFESTVEICGHCRFCRGGRPNLCSNRKIAGINFPGGFAEYSVRRERYVHMLPERVSCTAGALCEPAAVCVHAVYDMTVVTPGDIVTVVGPGPIGLLCTQLVAAAGGRVILVGTGKDRARLDTASSLGVEFIVNIDEQADYLENLVEELTDGYGVDIVLGCVGAPPAFNMGINLLRKGGRYTQIGLFAEDINASIDTLSYHELTLQGTFAQKTPNWKRALTLMGMGLLDTLPLVTTLPLSKWAEGFKQAQDKTALKVVFEPGK